jgi:hypothetical protein
LVDEVMIKSFDWDGYATVASRMLARSWRSSRLRMASAV